MLGEFKMASIEYLRCFNFQKCSIEDLVEVIELLKIHNKDPRNYQPEQSEDLSELRMKLTSKAQEYL